MPLLSEIWRINNNRYKTHIYKKKKVCYKDSSNVELQYSSSATCNCSLNTKNPMFNMLPPLLSADNVFRYSNKVITKLPDISRFIAVFSYYRQRNIQRFCLINHSERAMQTLLCLGHWYHFWIRNKLLAHFHKWKRNTTAGASAWLSQESVYQWMDFLSVAATWGSIPISSYWFWQCT